MKQASIEHAPFQAEETWVDQVAEATNGEAPQDSAAASSDPTIANAGLTELENPSAPNGAQGDILQEPASSGDVGNLAGERWDAETAGAGAEKGSLEDSYEIVPRPSEEVDTPAENRAQGLAQGTSWAEESHDAATGNTAGEAWDTKAPGETENTWGAETAAATSNGWGDAATATSGPARTDADGFSQVQGRGRGGHRGRGDGEFRGRGGRRGKIR